MKRIPNNFYLIYSLGLTFYLFYLVNSNLYESVAKDSKKNMNNKFIPQITKPEPQLGKLFERPMDTVEVKKYSWESFSPLLNENANVKLKK